MKPLKNWAPLLAGATTLAVALLCGAGTARAQDPVKVAPKNFKVLMENDRVRVLDFTANAGEKIPMHSHPAYISYSISGAGKTRFTYPGGKTTEPTAKTGQATWHDAETHASEYQGSGGTHVLLIELKDSGNKPHEGCAAGEHREGCPGDEHHKDNH
jgi:quercetin dioxygenase-like cupin family protein